MAHSHDRTLLASLGFADKDKKNPRHDLACQYLAQPEVFAKLMAPSLAPNCAFVEATLDHEHHITKGEAQYRTTIGFADLYCARCILAKLVTAPERILCPPKIRDEDIVLPESEPEPEPELSNEPELEPALPRKRVSQRFPKRARMVSMLAEQKRLGEERKRLEDEAQAAWNAANASAPLSDFLVFVSVSILVEVKIERLPVGDVLRQMRLYQDHLEDLRLIHPANVLPEVADTPRYAKCSRSTSPFDYYAPNVCLCAARHGSHYIDHNLSSWVRSNKIVVTDFPLTPDEVELLRSADIAHTRLGSGFEAYVEAQANIEPHASPEV